MLAPVEVAKNTKPVTAKTPDFLIKIINSTIRENEWRFISKYLPKPTTATLPEFQLKCHNLKLLSD